MTVCIFLGPTLPVAEARKILDARYLPPVRQGDVYRAVQGHRPRMIGIVDGCFHQVPSVWHKEILWAMAEGVHVFGSASMGALRAAELQAFGMEGIGQVFSDFRDGRLEDDDEVAVVHAPEEIGFVAASEAMVNIRRTLDAARAEAVLDEASRQGLETIAKSLFYPERTYPEILRRGVETGLAEDEISAFGAWLERGRIDVKRDDALSMLCRMKDVLKDDPPEKCVAYRFEHTTMWEAATAALRTRDCEESASDLTVDDWLMDEIRLDGAHDDLRRAALLRLLALREADRQNVGIDGEARRRAANDVRFSRGLHQGADFKTWLSERDLDHPSFDRLLGDTLLIDAVADGLQAWMAGFALDELRLGGDYPRLVSRARKKRRVIEAAGKAALDEPNFMEDFRATAWYFEKRLGVQPPDDLDAYARRRGFSGEADFRRAVSREFFYERLNDEASRS